MSADLEYVYSAGNNPAVDFLLFKSFDGSAQSRMAFGVISLGAGRWQDRFGEPTAFDDAIELQEDNVQEVGLVGFDPVFSTLLNSDVVVTVTQNPSHGTLGSLSLSNDSSGQLATWLADYTPNAEFSGTDIIKYTVTNQYGTSNEGLLTITINAVKY